MNLLLDKIKQDRDGARLAKDKFELAVLNALIAEVEKEYIAHPGETELTEMKHNQRVQEVTARQLKKLQSEKEEYAKLGKGTDKQEAEEKILLRYLPQQLTQDEIIAYVNEAIEKAKAGVIKNEMQFLSPELKGKANMKEVAKLVKELKGGK